ncbi:MAG: T9SS type A sorting domain-containing protein [Candidatus Delongbacteria bacterium]|nr:T9SS type A sorting domain-containing protein [Candidatus Delongbacteria bacterium]
MKNIGFIFLSFGLLFVFNHLAYSQVIVDCTPDTTIVDTANPGQVEPDTFPAAHLNEYYTQTVTIIPPAEYEDLPIIYSIIIDSVVNMPQGLNWGKNVEEFLVTDPDSHYCVEIYGIPEETGSFQLILYITPYVDVGYGPYPHDQQVDDTSIMIVVDDEGSIKSLNHNFEVVQAYPNPFKYQTSINFETGSKGIATLRVYNILGKLLYKEEKMAYPGNNRFDFTGNSLNAGTYIFSLELHGKKETVRLMKSR